ncbi:cortexin domain-containing 1-like, partial [Hypomesus transpacificus]|uniref:cortexin domain-containing 1-like n=1 Tax=Hypomesus transpacificus TaxID=137520 RepID=UPI001F08646B
YVKECNDELLRGDQPDWTGYQAQGLSQIGENRTAKQPTQSQDDHNRNLPPVSKLEVDVDLGFALFFLFVLCFFLLVTVVRCAQTVMDPYGAISTSTYQEEQITN